MSCALPEHFSVCAEMSRALPEHLSVTTHPRIIHCPHGYTYNRLPIPINTLALHQEQKGSAFCDVYILSKMNVQGQVHEHVASWGELSRR